MALYVITYFQKTESWLYMSLPISRRRIHGSICHYLFPEDGFMALYVITYFQKTESWLYMSLPISRRRSCGLISIASGEEEMTLSDPRRPNHSGIVITHIYLIQESNECCWNNCISLFHQN
jgi:hypothetical protein